MSDEKYKEIKIGKKVEFEDDFIQVEVPSEETTENSTEQPVVETPVVAKAAAKDEKRKSRAQERIHQLNKEKKDALALLASERAEKEELRKQLLANNKTSTTTRKADLEAKAKLITSQLADAMKNGDTDLVVELQDALMDTKMELKGVSYELANTPEVEATRESPTQQPTNQIAERAAQWIEEYPEFKTNGRFRSAAILINNQLLSEGFDVNADDFYEELDTRLGIHFPEVFGIQEKNSVELKQDKKSIPSVDDGEEDEQTDVKTKAVEKPSKVRTAEQTVSGSSRSSANQIQSSKNKNSVTLSPLDIAQAERWGLSLEQMARRIAHSEKNRDNNGYVPIMINK